MKWQDRGGALLMTLVILGMFMVLMVATMALISRQYKEIVGQEQEEQAFEIAEAGISYSLWLMDAGLFDYTSPPVIQHYELTDETKNPPEVLGTFDLAFEVLEYGGEQGPATVRVTATGNDLVLVQRQQTIEAVVQSDDLDIFRVSNWDHKP